MGNSLKFIILVALGIIGTSLFAQNGIEKRMAKNAGLNSVSHLNLNLVADFSGNPTSGNVPLTVSFTDLSSGNPTAWLWNFGDGTTSTERNPVHVFANAGVYTIKLTINDGASTLTKIRENYINVIEPSGCDSLNFPLSGEQTYYIAQNNFGEYKGYVSGNNLYGDLAKADYFMEYGDRGYIRGLICEFVVAKKTLTNDVSINFNIWKNDGAAGSPGTISGTVVKPISSIIQDVVSQTPTVLYFAQPVIISGPFYAGVVLPQIAGDTLALYTNTDGDSNPPTAWEQHSTQSWYAYNNSEFSWDLDVSHAIFPIVCGQVGIDENSLNSGLMVYPNPATEKFWIFFDQPVSGRLELSVIDVLGSVEKNIMIPSFTGESLEIDVRGIAKGVKVVNLRMGSESANIKLVVR